MAIDDNEDYTLTGAQVKDLAARIKAGGGGMTVYVDASFATPSSITGVFLNKALTVPADPGVMFDTILAGNIVVAIFDGGQSQELIELSSVNSSSRFPEVGQAFTSAISTNAVFSSPTVVTLLHDDYSDSWSVETTAVTAVNDATLTIQHNGANVQTFTANQSTNATANIETIWADDIEATTPVPAVETAMIADGAVTSAKIDWSTILTTLQYKGQLDKSSNLNNKGNPLTAGSDGFYGLNMYAGSGGTGLPSENTNGTLLVMSASLYNVITQIIIGGGVIYTRRYASGAWGHWFKYAGTDIGA